MSAHPRDDLRRLYEERFGQSLAYRHAVWRVLLDSFFQRYVRRDDAVLDLGCGYGEFISQVQCGQRYAMDLNPDAPKRVGKAVACFLQDCSSRWPLPDDSLDVVFTSNFFEHLPNRAALENTLVEVHRCLKPGARLIAMGPNIRCLPGAYWDFWDHHIPLTEKSLAEVLKSRDFKIELCLPRFLPYTMAGGLAYPLWCLKLYLHLPPLWRVWGKQFLLLASK
jgi:SAM-dependent methyltransferase